MRLPTEDLGIGKGTLIWAICMRFVYGTGTGISGFGDGDDGLGLVTGIYGFMDLWMGMMERGFLTGMMDRDLWIYGWG